MNWLTSRCAPLVALTALALASCDTGTDLNVDLPDTTSTSTEYQDLDVDAATVRLAPVQTLKTDHFLVGRLDDNVAGTTEARAYFNVVSGFDIPRGNVVDSLPSKLPKPVLDSVVMVMGFDKVYGSATMPVRFDVYKLPAPLDERVAYDGGTTVATGDALGLNLFSRLDRTQKVTTAATPTTPATTSTVPDPTVRLLLQRRAFPATPTRPAIPAIPSDFATSLFAQLAAPNFGDAQLASVLKGVALAPSAGHTGNIVSFPRTNAQRMVVYFHSADTLRRSYSIFFGPVYSGSQGLPSARDPRYFTQITNALPTALSALSTRAGSVSPTLLNGTSYIQEGTGLGTRVSFKGLDALMSTPGLTINRAELRVPVKPFTNALFANPAWLYAVEVDAGNNVLQRTLNFLAYDRLVQTDGASQLSTGSPAFGLLETTATPQYYSLTITNYLQAYISDKLDGRPASLVLVPTSAPVSQMAPNPAVTAPYSLSLNRAALDASNIRLRVYYSKK
jgi:hypothetical protein